MPKNIMLAVLPTLIFFVSAPTATSRLTTTATQQSVTQSADVVAAYRVCETFEHIMGEHLDFAHAFDQTFPKNDRARRAIAIAEAGYLDQDLSRIDTQILVQIYKDRMQLIYLALPLAGPSDREEKTFFPRDIRAIFARKPPNKWQLLPDYLRQLDSDVIRFRVHIGELRVKNADAAKRIDDFKAEARAYKLQPPSNFLVSPLHGYPTQSLIGPNQDYYQIGVYVVAKEGTSMKIFGIRALDRLF